MPDMEAKAAVVPFTEQLDKLETTINDCIETLNRLGVGVGVGGVESAPDVALTSAGGGVQARLDRCLQRSGDLAELCQRVVARVGEL